MFWLVILLAIPALIGAGARVWLKETVTLKEFLLLEVISVTIIAGCFFVARYGAMSDIEHWNGRVTGKPHGSQGCCHCRTVCSTCTDAKGQSYQCNCTTTCDHSNDYYWALEFSTGDEITIDNCEPNPYAVPKAWTDAYINEPASIPHRYQNYLLADPDSLLRRGALPQFLGEVPNFPQVYGYYHVNKVVSAGVSVPPEWEKELQNLNAAMGEVKQVDVTVVFTKSNDPRWADAVEAKWLYGPKNAVIVVMGVPDGTTIAWARVVTISRVEMLKVMLRDQLQGKSLTDAKANVELIRESVRKHFTRTPMEEFAYLSYAAKPSDGWLTFLVAMAFVLSIGLVAFMHHKDVFGEEWRGRRFGRRW